MTVNYTSLLALGQPVTGTESGTWGDDVNNAVTSYLDIAIAGTLTLTGDGAVTLANTQGTNTATNIGSTTAQYYILKVVGPLSATKVITAPSTSKTYLVVNTDSTYGVTVKASGQSGVTVAADTRALVVFNGTDYVLASTSSAAALSGTLGVSNGGTGLTTTPTNGQIDIGNGTGFTRTTLTAGANVTITNGAGSITISGASVDWANPGTIGSTTPNTGAFTTLSANGNFTISGSARRILGDFSNATFSNRTIFQTSTSNSGSGVFVIPNGTGSASDVVLCSSSDPSNTSYLLLSNQAALGGRSVVESGKSGTGTYYPLVFVTNNAEAMRITTSNEVYIGGTTDQGAYNLQVSGTGVWGAGVYVNGSDARIKENVVALQSGLDVVTKLNPVTFQYKSSWSKDTSVQPGFIAQELQTALAGEVYVDGVVKDGGQYLSVSYQTLIPILAKAIQELKAEFDAYKAAHP